MFGVTVFFFLPILFIVLALLTLSWPRTTTSPARRSLISFPNAGYQAIITAVRDGQCTSPENYQQYKPNISVTV